MKGEAEDQMAVLAVLAASAREAEELLAYEHNLEKGAIDEANRRLQQFMQAARHVTR
jgi:hypothetical protein